MNNEGRNMMRPWLATVVLVCAALALGWMPAAAQDVGTQAVEPHVTLGVAIASDPIATTNNAIDEYEFQAAEPARSVTWYVQWGGDSYWKAWVNQKDRVLAVGNRGAAPIIVWEPWVANGNPEQPAFNLDHIVSGAYDAYIDSWAQGIAAQGDIVYLRLAHEMNGNWYPWGAGVNGNGPGDYIAFWKHVYNRFAATPGALSKTRFVWSPNVQDGSYPPFVDFWPGEAYVNWFGLDGYNWVTNPDGSPNWRWFRGIFLASYNSLLTLALKPVMIGETASGEHADKDLWIERILPVLQDEMPRVRAFSWFNVNKERDWRLNSNIDARAAYRNMANSTYMKDVLL